METTEQKQNFVTDDLNLAAVLILQGVNPLKIDNTNPSHSIFEFEFDNVVINIFNKWMTKELNGNIPEFLRVRRTLNIKIKGYGRDKERVNESVRAVS